MRNAVGLDVSKATLDASAVTDNIRQSAKFPNTSNGLKQLRAWMDSLPDKNFHICMEATGNYYENAADTLSSAGYPVHVANPLKIHAYAKSRFKRTKTDKQDAITIAEYCRSLENKELHPYRPVSKPHQSLKRIIALREQIQQSKTAEKNRLQAAKDPFVQAIHKGNIEHLDRQLKIIDGQIAGLSAQTELKPVTDRLKTIPSVGQFTAAVLASYLLGNTYRTANQFAAFAGLSPQAKQSGTSVNGRGNLTKYGSRRLRGALFMSAMVAYGRNYFPEFIRRMVKKKKPKMVIITAIMRKLAVIAYHIHKKAENYDETRYRKAV